MEGCEGDHRVPPGYKFFPSEQELVSFYLLRKVLGYLDDVVTIPVCDLYGNTNPWDLWEILKESPTFNGSEVYVFTTLKRKSVKDSRVVRSVGLGCWSGEDSPKAVYSGDDSRLKIGSRKRFRFEKSRTEHDGGWIMMEYRLEKSWLEKIGFDVKDHNIVSDFVICKLKKNTRGQRKSVVAALSSSVASSSSVTDAENDNNAKKRKREGLQADEMVSEKNQRQKESSKTAADDELKEFTQSLENWLSVEHDDHVYENNDALKEFTESVENLLAVEYDDHVDESNNELKEFTESLENLLAVGYDHDESKGKEYEVTNEVMVDKPFFDLERFDNSSNNMFFDMDWLHMNHPDLAAAPSTDNLCNLNCQTSSATAVFDANGVFLF